MRNHSSSFLFENLDSPMISKCPINTEYSRYPNPITSVKNLEDDRCIGKWVVRIFQNLLVILIHLHIPTHSCPQIQERLFQWKFQSQALKTCKSFWLKIILSKSVHQNLDCPITPNFWKRWIFSWFKVIVLHYYGLLLFHFDPNRYFSTCVGRLDWKVFPFDRWLSSRIVRRFQNGAIFFGSSPDDSKEPSFLHISGASLSEFSQRTFFS